MRKILILTIILGLTLSYGMVSAQMSGPQPQDRRVEPYPTTPGAIEPGTGPGTNTYPRYDSTLPQQPYQGDRYSSQDRFSGGYFVDRYGNTYPVDRVQPSQRYGTDQYGQPSDRYSTYGSTARVDRRSDTRSSVAPADSTPTTGGLGPTGPKDASGPKPRPTPPD